MTIYTPRDFDPFHGFGIEEEEGPDCGIAAVFAVVGAIVVPFVVVWMVFG